ncbi:hypothetical protein [uncultured Pseudomonas sp.]|uniref:hypothetical protein n=1 Tax=uncultured Pseudomonas sp. TaxID=114707 RepID=UPI00258A3CC0|nr:hypothetical protein [uncultured Pseudomonas sp.]
MSLALTGIMLAHFDTGGTLVESFPLSVMGLPGSMARPAMLCIAVQPLIFCHRGSPRSRMQQGFIEYLQAGLCTCGRVSSAGDVA